MKGYLGGGGLWHLGGGAVAVTWPAKSIEVTLL